jgi:hypothetical protein
MMVYKKCEHFDYLLLYVALFELVAFGAAIVIGALEIGGFISV